MWNYEKRLQYPVNIKEPNPRLAQVIMSQFGGPDGELAASMRYLSQRYAMPYREVMGTLTDIGTEELAHLEMIGAIVHQLTRNLTPEEIVASGFDKYYVDHTTGIWPQAAGGIPFNACEFQSKGDPITDLVEDLAAEQKARSTYDNILRLVHQRIQRTQFVGEQVVKNPSGDLCRLTKLGNGNVLIGCFLHQCQQAAGNFPLMKCRYLCCTFPIHTVPPFLRFHPIQFLQGRYPAATAAW